MKWYPIVVGVAALLLAGGSASAQANKETDELKGEVEKLKKEVEALKAGKKTEGAKADPAAASTSDRLDELEVKAKDAVVVGDIPGAFRIPGTEISLHLYGFAEVNWVHEFSGDNSDIDYSTFAPYLPLEGSAQYRKRNRDYVTARTSRLGLEAAWPTKFGPLTAKIEGDFNNEPRTGNSAVYGKDLNVITQQQTNSYGFRLRHAYGAFAGFLAGQTWSTFMDVDNFPETVDFNGPIGQTFIRQPQLRYTYATPDLGNFTIALENSSSYVLDSGLNVIAASHSRFPDVVVRWDKGFDWGAVSARAMTQELRIDDGAGQKAAQRGWGVAATGLIKTRGDDFLSLNVTYGDGIGRYLNYIEGAFYDAANNRIVVERAIGVVVGYQLKATDWVRVNLVYGMTHNFDNDFTAFALANGAGSGQRFGINRVVQQAHLGPIFTPIKGVDLGIEGIWGARRTLSGEKGDMLRLDFSAKYYIN